MDAARDLFHDKDRSQFIIVTIPTLMAAAESARLAASLRQEGIPLETLVVNQVGPCRVLCAVLCHRGSHLTIFMRVAPYLAGRRGPPGLAVCRRRAAPWRRS